MLNTINEIHRAATPTINSLGVAFLIDLRSYLPPIEKEEPEENATTFRRSWALSIAIGLPWRRRFSAGFRMSCVPIGPPGGTWKNWSLWDTWPRRRPAASVRSFQKSITSPAEASENFGSLSPPKGSRGTLSASTGGAATPKRGTLLTALSTRF